MGIYEKPPKSGLWHISYCDRQGKRHREKIGRKADAVNAYADRKREIREGSYLPPHGRGILSFRKLAEATQEHKRLRLRPSTYKNDNSRLKAIYPILGAMEVSAITPIQIEDALARLIETRKLCGGSANRFRNTISNVFSYGLRMGQVKFNPVSRVKRFKESAGRVRWLRPEEEEKLRAVIQAKYPEREPELDLSLYTGMRRGEQYTLKWENVDLKNGLLTVHGKTGRRFITLNSSSRNALQKLRERSPEGAIYVSPDTKHDEQREHKRWFESAIREAQIPNFRRHDLRHTFASRLVMANVPLLTVKELLGHTSIVMTEKYAHLSTEHRAAAAEKIGRS